MLPGDKSEVIWNDYVPFAELPHVDDPPSGFVQSCNSTPWRTTTGEGNPRREAFAANLGIEDNLTNRSARSLTILGRPGLVSREDFLRMKWDRAYEPDAEIMRDVVDRVRDLPPADDAEREALAILTTWDRACELDSAGATIAILTWRGVSPDHAGGNAVATDAVTSFRATVKWLVARFGRVKVAWGDIHRLRRGVLDLPLPGGPDVINGVNARTVDDRLVGRQGDSLVMIVELGPGPGDVSSTSIHQYGASSRATSPHFADQAPLFVNRTMKPTWRRPEELQKHTERAYHPGE